MTTEPDRRDELEAWWALVARVLAFFLGAVVVLSQVLFEELELLELAIAAPLLGPAIVSGVSQIIEAARGGGAE